MPLPADFNRTKGRGDLLSQGHDAQIMFGRIAASSGTVTDPLTTKTELKVIPYLPGNKVSPNPRFPLRLIDRTEFDIVAVTTGAGTSSVTIDGDWLWHLVTGETVVIAGSTGNDGNKTVRAGSSYNAGSDRTTINLNQNLTSGIADGTVALYLKLPVIMRRNMGFVVGGGGSLAIFRLFPHGERRLLHARPE
jgi:hypothetical protein